MPTPPQFISTDVDAIVQQMVAYYEQETGKTLQPAQIERLLINTFAYREGLIREQIQDAALQNLVDFSRAPVLDKLGALVGAIRLAASPATATLRFTLVVGHGGVTIPSGTRVSSVDGLAIFRTVADASAPVGVNTLDVLCECSQTGAVGNGYALGTIINILDPQAFISTATNITVSGGGAETESDDEYRERIKLAPSAYSNAGSKGAYKFFAKSANPAIIDVEVTSPNPGEVEIFPLLADGSITPPTVLAQVLAACNDDKVRPLTDLVLATAPTRINYTLTVNLVLFNTADPTTTPQLVADAVNALVLAKRQQLGQDIINTQIIAAAQIDGVYSVTLPGFTNIIVNPSEYAFNTGVTVNVIGFTNG